MTEANGVVFVESEDFPENYLNALDAGNGSLLWRSPRVAAGFPAFTEPVVSQGSVYVAGSHNVMAFRLDP